MSLFMAGHRGMVGSAIMRQVEAGGISPVVRTHSELDLIDQSAVRKFMADEHPDAVNSRSG